MGHNETPYERKRSMNKRLIVKYAAKTIVMSVAGSTITKTLIAAFPQSERYNIAEITGAIGGFVIGEKLEPTTDKLVDDFFDKREAKTEISA